jgi:hypothetical protein
MKSNRAWTRWIGTILASGFVFSVGYLVVTGWFRWWTLRGGSEPAAVSGNHEVLIEAMLSSGEASQIQEMTRRLVNPAESIEAAAQMRDHFDALARTQPDAGSPSMVFFLQCLAPRFTSLDTQTRQLCLAMVSDILGWFGTHDSPCWIELLAPTGSILGAAASDSSTDVTLACMQLVRACWEWAPPEVTDDGHRKALGMWKAELHSRCVELMRSPNEKVRASAGVTVVTVPLDSAASRGLILLRDDAASVRRSILLALAERQELLANEDVVGFLRDSSTSVRTSAETVLASRGLTPEQIVLAKRATDPSPIVRAQTPRHIVESNAVDRVVWLRHLSQDVAPTVRAEAARALASVGTEECLDRLDQMAHEDPDMDVRQLAISLAPSASRPRSTSQASGDGPETLPTLRTPRAN